MKNSKKLLISSLFLAFFCSSCGCGTPASSQSGSLANTGEGPMASTLISCPASEPNFTEFDVYCVNDFHGSVLEQNNGKYYEAGIKKYFGFLEEKKAADPDHTIILSAGDMFQGSFESNFNYGHLVIEAMNALPFDSMTLGNHEFDYGREKLLELKQAASFPFLAGNIRKVEGTTDLGDYEEFDSYHIFERGGYKFGVVGMIGANQTTSITSSFVSDLNFDDPERYALDTSKYLKDQGCDCVFLVIHDDAKTVAGWNVGNTLSEHFDGVFCGHTHALNKWTRGGLTLLQGYCNGEAYSHLKLGVSKGQTKQMVAEVISANKTTKESAKISAVCEKYFANEEYLSKANGVAGTLTDGYLSATTVADLGCKAIYEKAVKDHPDLVLAMQNKQRANVAEGTVAYRDLYKAMPFMNKIYIVDILGSDIIHEAQLNETYSKVDLTLDPSAIYRIAVIDYLLFHQNANKEYDYFPSLGTDKGVIVDHYDEYPVDITYDYVKNTLGGTFSYFDFNGSKANGFNVMKSR